MTVELVPHDRAWADIAAFQGARFAETVGANIVAVHHIGSTAIPDILAKPIIDLLPVVARLDHLGACREAIERAGYEYCGAYGLSGRRYCRFSDPSSGRRLVQLHCYERGHADIRRHLAFRDYLRAHADIAHEYGDLKLRCRDRHPDDAWRYADCKDGWIKRTESEALRLGFGV